jgi:halocyanin-like protein
MGCERRTILGVCGAVLSGTASGCLRLTEEDEPVTENREVTRSTTASRIERELGEETYEWLSAGTAFDGIVDRTGSDSATVSVGDDAIDRSIDPAVLKISPGTTVTWEWTGEGGGHNIVAMDESFSFESITLSDDAKVEHVFPESGVHRYYCEPHEPIGGRGVIVVDE